MRRIQVIFASGEIGCVHHDTLEHLLRENDIVAFRRSFGWVQIDRHRVRISQERFCGPRKRWNDALPLPCYPNSCPR